MAIDDFIADFVDFLIAPVGIVVAPTACMQAQAQILKDRTFRFAVDIVKFVRKLPNTFDARRIGGQLFDAATSVAANYRSACKARSHADFVSKIGIVAEESDESEFWLDILTATNIATIDDVKRYRVEASELAAIFTASHKTASERKRSHPQ